MVIPIDTKLAIANYKRSFTRWTTAKIKRMTWLTRPTDCQLCGRPIRKGEYYRDGGIHQRAHDACVVRTDSFGGFTD